MKTYLFLASLLLLVFVVDADKKKIDTHSNVLLLDSENFDQALKEHKYILVDFYVPYCKKCSLVLRSEWGAAAIEIRDDIKLGKVDISKGSNHKLANRFELCEYPSFRFFKDGKPFEYDGGFTKNKIISWLTNKIKNSPALNLKSEKGYKSFVTEVKVNNGKVPVIGYYSDSKSDGAKAFLETAEDGISGVEFAILSDPSLFSDLKIKDGQLVMHHPEMNEPIVITTASRKSKIKDAIIKNKLPLLRDFVDYDLDMKIHTEAFENHLFVCTSSSSNTFSSEKEFFARPLESF